MAQITTSLVAPPPKHSLNVSIAVSAGIAQSTRSLGMYTGYYPSIVSTTELYVDLVAGASWSGAASGAIFVNTNQPLTFLGVKEDDSIITVNITRMMFLDDEFKAWSLSNNTNSTASVFISASTPSGTAGVPVESPVKSVNGQLPDASGNVTVNTGVMTINNDLPDTDGNINTDENTY
jgi:hypothetical protein